MKIIFQSDSEISSAPKVLELNPRRAWALAAAVLLLAAAGIYGTARKLAETWLLERAPVALSLAAEIETARKKEEATHARNLHSMMEDEIANLRAGITELRGRGDALAKRLGLGDFVAIAPSLACDSDGDADGDSGGELTGGAKTVDINHYRDLMNIYSRKHDVIVEHGASTALTFDTVPLQRPVMGKNWLSSRFGMRRDPLTGRKAFHAGYDYAARRGTPILAGATGIITYAGWLGNYGKAVRITHGDGVSTLYGHMQTMYVAAGRYVRRGDIIGEIGSTGRSTGPHLHYEVRINNRPRPVASAVKKLRAARAVPAEWEI